MFGGMLWPWMWVGGDEVRLPHRVRRWDADGVAFSEVVGDTEETEQTVYLYVIR